MEGVKPRRKNVSKSIKRHKSKMITVTSLSFHISNIYD